MVARRQRCARLSGMHLRVIVRLSEVPAGIDQRNVSALMGGCLYGFSVDRRSRFLLTLDRDVEILVTPRKRQHPHTRVSVVPGSYKALARGGRDMDMATPVSF